LILNQFAENSGRRLALLDRVHPDISSKPDIALVPNAFCVKIHPLYPNLTSIPETLQRMMNNLSEQIIEVARLLFERKLLDIAGGNVSARSGSTIFMSPRYSGGLQHWQITPEDIVSGELGSPELLSHPRLSRESKVHLAVYTHYPFVNGIIHAHSMHVLPFVAAGKAIPLVLEQTEKFGAVEPVPAAPAHTNELAENVVAGLRDKESNIRKQAAAVILPRHGILVAGKDLLAAADALERIDWNAWCVLAMRWID
jgi:L-fuculose-phosphate aldolase